MVYTPERLASRKRRDKFHTFQLAVEELETRALPSVLTPVQVRHAYGFDQVTFTANSRSIAADGSGQTIAIIDAYDDPNIASDVDMFDKTFKINGSQTIYQKYGASSKFLTKAMPGGQTSRDPTGLWALETALDVEWAHVVAPGAKILLVEAKSSSYADLLAAVDYARNQPGVVAISMSFGSVEFASETSLDSHFTTPAGHKGGSNGLGGANLAGGIAFVASAGDSGAPGEWPAMSPYVLAVGGSNLQVDASGNYRGETTWTKGGGGTSTIESAPTFQSGAKRTIPDVSYNGDPATGVYVYTSVPLNGQSGPWWQVGGTSAGAPQWAALVAIADQGRALAGQGSLDGPSQLLPAIYGLPAADFHDVTSGSNGNAAKAGYDLATGRGTPIASKVIAGLVSYRAPATTTSSTAKTGTVAGTVKPRLDFSTVISVNGPDAPSPTTGAVDSSVVGLLSSPATTARFARTATIVAARNDNGSTTSDTANWFSPSSFIRPANGIAGVSGGPESEVLDPQEAPNRVARPEHDAMGVASTPDNSEQTGTQIDSRERVPTPFQDADNAAPPEWVDCCFLNTHWLPGGTAVPVESEEAVDPTAAVAAALLLTSTGGLWMMTEPKNKIGSSRRKKSRKKAGR